MLLKLSNVAARVASAFVRWDPIASKPLCSETIWLAVSYPSNGLLPIYELFPDVLTRKANNSSNLVTIRQVDVKPSSPFIMIPGARFASWQCVTVGAETSHPSLGPYSTEFQVVFACHPSWHDACMHLMREASLRKAVLSRRPKDLCLEKIAIKLRRNPAFASSFLMNSRSFACSDSCRRISTSSLHQGLSKISWKRVNAKLRPCHGTLGIVEGRLVNYISR